MGCSSSVPVAGAAPIQAQSALHAGKISQQQHTSGQRTSPIKQGSERRQDESASTISTESRSSGEASSSGADATRASPLPAAEDDGSKMQFAVEHLADKGAQAFNRKAKPRKPLLKTSSYVGWQLLALAKQNPALQKVAFMLGAVTAHAMSARALKVDAARIAKVVELTEQALVKLATVTGNKLGDLSELQEVLDDTMKVLEKLRQPKTRQVVDESIAQLIQDGVLVKLRDRLQKCVEALNESAAIAQRELETMSKASFRESAIISDVLTESGLDQCQGKEWTADPAAKEAAQKAEKLLADKAAQLREADSLVDDELVQSVLARASSSDSEEPAPLSEQPAQPDALQSYLVKTQASQMRAMVKSGAADIKAFLQRWPLAEGEAERLLVVLQNKLLDRATSVDVSDITGEIQSRLNTLYMGCYIIGYDSVHLLHCRADGRLLGQEPGTQVAQKGRVQARKFSLCQRTAAAPPNTRIIHVPLGDIPSCFDASLFANMALAGADAGIAGQAARMGNPGSDKLIDDFLVLLKHAGDAIGSGMELQHTGCSIEIEGQKVGAFCMLHPPSAWSDDSERFLIHAADRVAERLLATGPQG